MTIREELFLLAENDYRRFQQKLLPDHCELIGVRLPILRKIAKRIVKEDYPLFLSQGPEDYFEEKMLKGMVIGYLDPEKAGLDTIIASINKMCIRDRAYPHQWADAQARRRLPRSMRK